MGHPNNHRAWKVTRENFDKPWKVKRLLGKYVKCSICKPKPPKYKRTKKRITDEDQI